ncbi:hypothetical protein HZB89_01410 [archaeon]|nr:hypothetical protein [archaeon]
MAEKLSLNSGLTAGAVTGIVLYILCGIAVYAFPQAAMGFFNTLIHSTIALTPKTFEAVSFIVGLIESAVLGALVAGIFVFAYNKFLK